MIGTPLVSAIEHFEVLFESLEQVLLGLALLEEDEEQVAGHTLVQGLDRHRKHCLGSGSFADNRCVGHR